MVRKPEFDELIPSVDVPILKTLPKEGSTIGQLKPLARNVRAISNALGGALANSEVSGRVQTLMRLGYIARTQLIPLSQGKGYQITPKGEAFVRLHTREEN